MRMAITLLFLIISTCSWGKELPKLEGKSVLTISGKIENSNQNGAAVFDIAGLEKSASLPCVPVTHGIMTRQALRVFP